MESSSSSTMMATAYRRPSNNELDLERHGVVRERPNDDRDCLVAWKVHVRCSGVGESGIARAIPRGRHTCVADPHETLTRRLTTTEVVGRVAPSWDRMAAGTRLKRAHSPDTAVRWHGSVSPRRTNASLLDIVTLRAGGESALQRLPAQHS
jgi:hypothetical protein